MTQNDTSHSFINRLAKENSTYLLQHAHNPVDWYPWSEDALVKAKDEDKPIFLSIGYSTCHWCHVMAHESFEDQEVANILNKHYISIKVDREERPDIDQIYMTVCQALTGQGGWPLTIVMTPDKEPFFAGTYFPKHSKYGRIGFIDLLTQLYNKWETEHDRVVDTGRQITEAILKYQGTRMTNGEVSSEILDRAYKQYTEIFDPEYGGFGEEPKFPSPHNLGFLLRHWKLTGETHALQMVEKTLDSMNRGGIYDHVGYGFSRYSVDQKWLVPHFEKMLYDNALLALIYIDAFQATDKKVYAEVAQQIFEYVVRDMTDPDGGFYSAEDADSEGEEGKFYVWSPEEVHDVLGEEHGQRFCELYGITQKGNFENEKSIPNLIHKTLERTAQEQNMTVDDVIKFSDTCRAKLFEVREKREHPHKDDKILTAWNGLMIAALARGSVVLSNQEYLQNAVQAVRFIKEKLKRDDGRLLARYRNGEAAYPGYVDDYAFLIWGLLELYEATFDVEYLTYAMELQEQQIELFWDEENGGFYFYGSDAEQLLMRPKELYDGAMPSGNSVSAMNMLRLTRITGNQRLMNYADKQISTFAAEVAETPQAHAHFLMAIQFLLGPTKEIVITANSVREADEMLKLVQKEFLPNSVISVITTETRDKLQNIAPMLRDKIIQNGKTTAYVCENFACKAPTTDLERFMKQLQ